VDAIDGLVDRIEEEWGKPDALVVATGGYADLMAQHCRTVSQVETFLTLKGLYFAGEHLAGG
jgi:type III pantothenate kinase